ncbi:flagellar export chaperone FlgN [Rheinheimera tilapiae]|jgi:flagella synthesis protein FlgN|uniref:Flagellar export chaperone FlgN n=1 Tax=Rheinheimera tilapiae TaxID=875043 RepID=A0ABV6BH63_9GAMM
MTSQPPVLSLLTQQQEHLDVLLLLLKQELSAISNRDIAALEENSTVKLRQLEQIQLLDQQIASHPDLPQLKTALPLISQVRSIDSVLLLCKEQNEINRLTLEQSQLKIERFKHELLQQRGKSGLTYNAKGKPSLDSVGKGIKA